MTTVAKQQPQPVEQEVTTEKITSKSHLVEVRDLIRQTKRNLPRNVKPVLFYLKDYLGSVDYRVFVSEEKIADDLNWDPKTVRAAVREAIDRGILKRADLPDRYYQNKNGTMRPREGSPVTCLEFQVAGLQKYVEPKGKRYEFPRATPGNSNHGSFPAPTPGNVSGSYSRKLGASFREPLPPKEKVSFGDVLPQEQEASPQAKSKALRADRLADERHHPGFCGASYRESLSYLNQRIAAQQSLDASLRKRGRRWPADESLYLERDQLKKDKTAIVASIQAMARSLYTPPRPTRPSFMDQFPSPEEYRRRRKSLKKERDELVYNDLSFIEHSLRENDRVMLAVGSIVEHARALGAT